MRDLAIFISAFNEETVIGSTLDKLLTMSDPEDIYIMSDGSTDKTREIVGKYSVNYKESKINSGKVQNIKKGFKEFNLLSKYRYMLVLDADTIPDKNFVKIAIMRLKEDGVACVCGVIESQKDTNVFVAYRIFLYVIWQQLYKRIYALFNAVPIAPGTASIYKTSVLKQIKLNGDIIIEDFDLTYQVHRKHLGRIVFEPKARVTTQDPNNLRDTYNQVARWQLGFIQSAVKHRVPLGFQAFDIAIIISLIMMAFYTYFLVRLLILVIWIGLFAIYPFIFGNYVDLGVLIKVTLFDYLVIWAMSTLVFVITGYQNQIKYGPILWLVQFVYIASLFKSIYLAIFKSVSGAWVKPTRR